MSVMSQYFKRKNKRVREKKVSIFLCGFDATLAYKLQSVIKGSCPILKSNKS